MQNLTFHLGSAAPFSSRVGQRTPARHSCLPALTATGAYPRRCHPASRGTPPTGLPLLFFPLSRAVDRARSTKQPTRHSFALPSPTSLRPPLSSATSLPIAPTPEPPPPATGGLSFVSDFAEHRRRLPPLR
jgi:hypothetical protein